MPCVEGNRRAVSVGHDAGQTADANGRQFTVEEDGKMYPNGTKLDHSHLTKPSRSDALVFPTSAFYEVCESAPAADAGCVKPCRYYLLR